MTLGVVGALLHMLLFPSQPRGLVILGRMPSPRQLAMDLELDLGYHRDQPGSAAVRQINDSLAEFSRIPATSQRIALQDFLTECQIWDTIYQRGYDALHRAWDTNKLELILFAKSAVKPGSTPLTQILRKAVAEPGVELIPGEVPSVTGPAVITTGDPRDIPGLRILVRRGVYDLPAGFFKQSALCAVSSQAVQSDRSAETKRIVWLLESCPRPDAALPRLAQTTQAKFSEVARHSNNAIRRAVRAYMGTVPKGDIVTWWQRDIKLFELNRYLFNVSAGTLPTTPGLFECFRVAKPLWTAVILHRSG